MKRQALWLAGVGGFLLAAGVTGAGESTAAGSTRPGSPNLSRYPEFQDREGQALKLPRLPDADDNELVSESVPMGLDASPAAKDDETRADQDDTPRFFRQPTASERDEERKAGWEPVEQLIYGGENGEFDSPGAYRFVVRDRIALFVEGHPEFEGEIPVQQDGTVVIPNTNDSVLAKDRTTEELARDVAQVLSPYLRTPPRVTVKAVRGQGGYYYIFGEVMQQGRFPMGLDPIRLSEAVFRANSSSLGGPRTETRESRLEEETSIQPRSSFGLSDYARLTQVNVITPHRSHPTRKTYNVKKALLQGVTGEDPYIRPGQIIWVPNTADKRMMKFIARVIDPLGSLQSLDGTGAHWYKRTTGHEFKDGGGNPAGSSTTGAQ